VAYGEGNRSRIDLLLRDEGRPDVYIEIKNTTLKDGQHAAFPDAVTERGRKHLEDLAGVVAQGHRGVLFFFVGRADCDRFRPADEVDPAYGETLRRVAAEGVEILAWRMRFSRWRIEALGAVPVDL
jgi:sugar fermentation stimulation protein A